MGRVDITFDTDNASFEEDFENELGAVMHCVRRRILADQHGPGMGSGAVMDSNGNTIGRWTHE